MARSEQVSAPGLDSVIHPLPRLRICALLEPVKEEEFATLRDLLETTDSALSKQLSTLTKAGYVAQRRAPRGGKSRIWTRLTPTGRLAFQKHLAALAALTQRPQ